MGVGDVLLLLRCILCVPMSTIDGYWLSFGTPPVARGRCARFVVFPPPLGSALIGCARNRKSFRHMASGFKDSETYTYYLRLDFGKLIQLLLLNFLYIARNFFNC